MYAFASDQLIIVSPSKYITRMHKGGREEMSEWGFFSDFFCFWLDKGGFRVYFI